MPRSQRKLPRCRQMFQPQKASGPQALFCSRGSSSRRFGLEPNKLKARKEIVLVLQEAFRQADQTTCFFSLGRWSQDKLYHHRTRLTRPWPTLRPATPLSKAEDTSCSTTSTGGAPPEDWFKLGPLWPDSRSRLVAQRFATK